MLRVQSRSIFFLIKFSLILLNWLYLASVELYLTKICPTNLKQYTFIPMTNLVVRCYFDVFIVLQKIYWRTERGCHLATFSVKIKINRMLSGLQLLLLNLTPANYHSRTTTMSLRYICCYLEQAQLTNCVFVEAVVRRYSIKKVFLHISQNSHESISVTAFLLRFSWQLWT